MKLSRDIIQFFEKRGVVIVSTIDEQSRVHCSVKGLVGIEEKGKVFIIDLYVQKTFNNLKNNPTVSLTAVDEHNFVGFTLQGKARIVPREEIKKKIVLKWEERIIRRISTRIVKNLQPNSAASRHHEAALPDHQYLIEVDVDNIIDLSPPRK